MNGLSAAYDAYGRVVATLPANGAPPQTLRITMPIGGVSAPYSHIGDLFAWLCLAALGALGIFSVLPKRRFVITPQPVEPAETVAAE
jgi:apolipoprotein N-acyltransferase